MKRRALLKVFGLAPAVILTPGLLMPVKSILMPDDGVTLNSIAGAWDWAANDDLDRFVGKLIEDTYRHSIVRPLTRSV